MSVWDKIDKALTFGGALLDIFEKKRAGKVNTEWAKFNRERDVRDLQFFLQRQKDAVRIDDLRVKQISGTDRVLTGMERQLLGNQKAYYDLMHQLTLDTSQAEADEAYDTRMAQIASQVAALDTRSADIASRRRLLPYQAGVLEADRDALEKTTNRRLAAIGGREKLLGVEETAREKMVGARMAAIGHGQRALFAQREELQVTGQARAGARIQEARQELGEAVAGQAARGISGSFGITERARIGQELSRDLGVLGAQQRAAGAQLDVSGARLMAERTGVETGAAVDAARAAAQGLELSAERSAVITAQATGRARLGQRGAELQEEGIGLTARETQVEKERGVLDIQSGHLGSQRDRAIAKGKLDAVSHQLQAGRAELDAAGIKKQEDRLSLEEASLKDRIEQSGAAAGIAEWTLKNMPETPDYEGAAIRSSIGTLLAAGGNLIPD